MPVVISGKPLSDLIGAHDRGDFVSQVEMVSPLSPILDRGSVVCRLANGQMTLAGTQGSTPATVYGIVLDFQVDPQGQAPDLSTCTVARNGVFNAEQLIVNNTVALRDYEDRLREIGILLEKIELVPPLPPPLGGSVREPPPRTIQETLEQKLKSS